MSRRSTVTWLSLATAALLFGCPKHPASSPESFTAQELLRLDGTLRFEEFWERKGRGVSRSLVRQSYAARPDLSPPEELSGAVWEELREEVVPDRSGAPAADWATLPSTLYVLGPDGWIYFAMTGDAADNSFEPKVQLPPVLSVGSRWSSESAVDDGVETRTCVAEATAACGEGRGVAASCTTLRPGRRIWVRNHYCVGLGSVGFEAVLERDGQVTRVWDVGATLDHEPLPRRPLSEREFIEAADFI